jgi:hypothetical protein
LFIFLTTIFEKFRLLTEALHRGGAGKKRRVFGSVPLHVRLAFMLGCAEKIHTQVQVVQEVEQLWLGFLNLLPCLAWSSVDVIRRTAVKHAGGSF